MNNTANQILIGRGIFTWQRVERISDRYGSCWLQIPNTEAQAKCCFPKKGQKGKLIAQVLRAHESPHIGDFARGFTPKTPKDGDVFVLGEGAAFTDEVGGIKSFGVKPTPYRETDWLNPRSLYNIHNSEVELIWEPEQEHT